MGVIRNPEKLSRASQNSGSEKMLCLYKKYDLRSSLWNSFVTVTLEGIIPAAVRQKIWITEVAVH